MIHSDKIADVTLRPDQRGRCFTGLEVLAAVGAAATVASTGMSIAGSFQQADGQREAGDIAYQNALARNAQAEAEAKRLEDEAKRLEVKANSEQAISQRQGLEEKRKSRILAGRAQTVMAASGGGVDTNILAGILGEGELGLDTALAEGDQKAQDSRYDAELRRYDAELRRWEGRTQVQSGAATRAAMNRRASNTETMGIVGGGLKLASLASKYGDGPAPGGGDGISAGSVGSTKSAYSALPNSYRAPGFDDDWLAI